jgi:uncharacterized membrane protein YeiB
VPRGILVINPTLRLALAATSLGAVLAVVASPFSTTPGGAASALRCTAYTSKTAHTGYSTETVHITTSARAHVTGAAHYQGMTRVETASANSAGTTLMTFRNPSTHSRYRVVIDLTVTLGTARGTCATAFTLG